MTGHWLRRRQAAERLACGPAWTDSGCVFTREDGEALHPGIVTKRLYDAVKGAGVPRIRLHDLRHTSATLALAAGVHAKVVQERLGHATISQTLDTYSHTTASLHEGAAETLAALVDGAAGEAREYKWSTNGGAPMEDMRRLQGESAGADAGNRTPDPIITS